MSALLYSLGRWCYRHRWGVIAGWLVALLVLGTLALSFRGEFDENFEIPGSPSQVALEKLQMTFPEGAALSATAVIVAPEGTDIEKLRPQIEAGVKEFEQLDIVDRATSPWNDLVDGLVADDHRAAVINLTLGGGGGDVHITDEQREELVDIGEQLENELPEGSSVDMGGEAFNIELPHLSVVEAVGLLVALVVLTVVLGSLVAAGLPIITAVIGVGLAMTVLLLVTRVATISSVTPMLAVMLGLAVGIDYALFILSRHRDQLREGMDLEESTGRAVGTAGSAVVFAGLTVFIALLGLSVAGIPFITIMGIFAAIAVVFAVVIALTMLPALMSLVGERMRPKKARQAMQAAAAPSDGGATVHAAPAQQDEPKEKGSAPYRWWVSVTTRHPIVVIVVTVLALAAVTVPAMGMRLSLPNSGQHEATARDRIAFDLMEEHFGPGINAPLVVTAQIIGSTDPLGLVDELKADVEKIEGVKRVAMATPNENADTALLQIIPTTGPTDHETVELVERLRELTESWKDSRDLDAAVTGFTAVQIDISESLGRALLPFALLVVGLSLVLLAAVFRSVWVPIKATLGYLFSVGAAFGAATMVFNDGFLKEVINLEKPMPLISFLPLLVMGILFGLAMDYEVFLVSRIREEYVHGKSATDAIRHGFVASGPVVVAAALIMFAVFAFFVPTGIGPIKQIAFALAIGVAVDAFAVRMTLVPAVMTLLGDRAWYLPRWLDKLLPSFDVEGEVLTRELEMTEWPGDGSVLYAEDVAVEGVLEPLSLRAMPGNVLGIAGPVSAHTGAALALSGRLGITGGRARVAGELLPGAGSRARRRTDYVDLAHSDDVAAAVSALRPREGGAVLIDSAERIASPEERRALWELVQRTRAERSWAVLLCGGNPQALSDLDVDGVVIVGQSNLQGSPA